MESRHLLKKVDENFSFSFTIEGSSIEPLSLVTAAYAVIQRLCGRVELSARIPGLGAEKVGADAFDNRPGADPLVGGLVRVIVVDSPAGRVQAV